tara:strand:- start:117970 stop:118590 length:621 start_codon:yes stop_codon:yes gene_type:complete
MGMSWYRRIQAATLPMRDLGKAIRETLKNMIPGVSQVYLDYVFVNQNPGEPRRTVLEGKAPFFSARFPIMYVIFVHATYNYGTETFETDSASEGITYTVGFGINMEWTLAALDSRPHYKEKILSLVDKMRIGKFSSADLIHEGEYRSIYEASTKAVEFMNYFESLIDRGGDGEDDTEHDPWFPGDPAADWEFEQEEQSMIPKSSYL